MILVMFKEKCNSCSGKADLYFTIVVLLTGLFLFLSVQGIYAQSLPLNQPVFQDYIRREQLIDTTSGPVSFNVRPLYLNKIEDGKYSELMAEGLLGKVVDKKSFVLRVMPATLTHSFNSNYPYGWGNGAEVPAKGQQFLLNAGIHVQAGPVSIQLYPQYHYAQNLPFEEYPEDAPITFFEFMERGVGDIDLPVRYGDGPISELLPGNSHVKVMFGGFAAGVSTENIWWGPARYNPLMIGDNAQGFPHATLHTTKPVKTFLGHFEGQYIMGSLEGSGHTYYSDKAYSSVFKPIQEDDWRYFTGITVSYSPRWLPGLSLGASRAFQIYRGDMEDNIRAWVPLFSPLPKDGEGVLENVNRREDQVLEFYFRWAIPEAHSELYFEFMRTDHSLNWRETILNLEHSRGYVIGASKYIPMANGQFIGLSLEMTQTQNSINNIIRWDGLPNRGRGLYDNYQVIHGVTNRGQVLGSGLGRSGNIQILEISHVKGLKKIALQLERYARDQNFYQYANSNGEQVAPWIDFAVGGKYEDEVIDHLLLQVQMRLIKGMNYNFYAPYYNEKDGRYRGDPALNLNTNIGLSYLF
ncbi:capsule assembly Wzi family protein [Echinicola soli]|uniref:Capsule assembly Wzi family protein n=2 Tax=Echinicola soli TaxID=2591634 RepID=A0A514CLV5_9BACT|nr:capsule assembly Wzi family protein [Echinicola soli]